MDFFITFFRDVLDGPMYIVVAIICGVLICSCIGYLGERYLKEQEKKKEYDATHAAIAGEVVDASALTAVPSGQPENVASMPKVNDTVAVSEAGTQVSSQSSVQGQ